MSSYNLYVMPPKTAPLREGQHPEHTDSSVSGRRKKVDNALDPTIPDLPRGQGVKTMGVAGVHSNLPEGMGFVPEGGFTTLRVKGKNLAMSDCLTTESQLRGIGIDPAADPDINEIVLRELTGEVYLCVRKKGPLNRAHKGGLRTSNHPAIWVKLPPETAAHFKREVGFGRKP